MTTSDIFMIILTAIIAVAGVVGAVIFHNQLGVMQHTLDEMRAQRRAWISVKAEISDLPNHALLFGKNSAMMMVKLTFKNSGQTPALRVTPLLHLYGFKATSESTNYIKPEFCTEKTIGLGNGIAIFPGETAVIESTPVTNDLPKGVHTDIPGDGAVFIYVGGCVRYYSGDDPMPHFTGVWFQVVKSTKRWPEGTLLWPDMRPANPNIAIPGGLLIQFDPTFHRYPNSVLKPYYPPEGLDAN